MTRRPGPPARRRRRSESSICVRTRREHLLHGRADALAVGAALDLRHHQRHDLAHLLRRGGAGLGDDVADDRAQLLVGELLGQVGLDHLGLALLGLGEVVAAGVAVGLGGLEPALALALEHVDLVAAVVLLGLLQLVGDQAQRAGALAVARLERGRHVIAAPVRGLPSRSSVGGMDPIKVATFDCYGTLIDWEGGAARSCTTLARRHGEPDPPPGARAARALGGDPVRGASRASTAPTARCSPRASRAWAAERG